MMVALILLIVAFFSTLQAVAAVTRQTEIRALETLYKSTGGGSEGHWNFTSLNGCIVSRQSYYGHYGFQNLTGVAWNFTKNGAGDYENDPCAAQKFAGIGCTCSASNLCNITQLSISCAKVKGSIGSIVTALRNFTQLNYLGADTNELTGTIPSAVGDFTDLTFFSLFVNSLTGKIPSSLGRLTKLKYLDLERNPLQGSIPSSLGQLTNLEYIWLSTNGLSGSIPSELGQLTNVQRLYLYSNSLTGPIPPQIGNISSLIYLSLADNLLSGTISRELEKLEKLTNLYLFGNLLTGTIPKWFGTMGQLEHMYLSKNSFSGSIPAEVGNIKNLTIINLSGNLLSGSIPAMLGQLINLQKIYLTGNSLTGFIPAELGQCKNLTSIDLSNNALTGTIPSNFSALHYLERFLVHENTLQSSIDAAGGATLNFIDPLQQRQLQYVDISSNDFTGNLPEFFFDLPLLEVLYVGSNCFSGILPSNMCNAISLSSLSFPSVSSGRNCRSYIWAGTIFERRFTAYLATKQMDGSLPSCLFELPRLQTLSMNGNNILGVVPETISPSLKEILFSRNKLFGTISASLATSANLKSLDLSFNRIKGTLDAFASISNNQFYTKKGMTLDLKVNRLSGEIPLSLHNLGIIDILGGNLFACSAEKSELPVNDPLVGAFRCGSDNINLRMYMFAAAMFVAAVFWWWCMRYSTGIQICYGKFKLWIRVAAGQNHLCDEISSAQLVRYSRYLQKERWFGFMIGVSAFVAMVCYLSLAADSSNLSVNNSYAWVLTAAYKTGPKSTVVILSCGIVFLLYIWFLIYLDKRKVQGMDRPDVLLSPTAPTEKNNVEEDATFSMKLRTTVLPAVRISLVILVLFGTITGGNFWFVTIQLTGSKEAKRIFQLGFAAFKLVWSMEVTPALFETHKLYFGLDVRHHDQFELSWFGGRYQLLFVMNIFISFLIPIFTIVLVDKACFYNALYQPDKVQTFTSIEECAERYTSGACAISGDYTNVSTTVDPFIYGYSCSNSILNVYVPLFMQMSFLLIAKSTLSLIYLIWDTWNTHAIENATADKTPWKLKKFMELILRVTPNKHLLYDNTRRKLEHRPGRVFKTKVRRWITRALPGNLANMTILLTFGFAAPPLAVMIITSMFMNSYLCQLTFGKFLEAEMSVLLEHKRLERQSELPMSMYKPDRHFISLNRLDQMQQSIKEIHEPWGALAALKEVEHQCLFIPASALVKERSTFILTTAILFALLLVDVQNCSLHGNIDLSAAIVMISVACAIVLFTFTKRKYLQYVTSETPPTKYKTKLETRLGLELTSVHSDLTGHTVKDTTTNPICNNEELGSKEDQDKKMKEEEEEEEEDFGTGEDELEV